MPYSTTTRAGFIRLKLSGGFGTDTYPVALATWIKSGTAERADGAGPADDELAHASTTTPSRSST